MITVNQANSRLRMKHVSLTYSKLNSAFRDNKGYLVRSTTFNYSPRCRNKGASSSYRLIS